MVSRDITTTPQLFKIFIVDFLFPERRGIGVMDGDEVDDVELLLALSEPEP